MRARRAAAAGLAAVLCACGPAGDGSPDAPDAQPGVAQPSYVGSTRCAECHAEQAAAWTRSDHDLALQAAGPESLLGDFDGAFVETREASIELARRDGTPVARVHADEADAPAEHEVTHALGVAPLQQVLVELPGGRRQALDAAWDDRSAAEGGQRWFRPYSSVQGPDAPHWQSPLLNWNGMCADCHSTDVRKGYDPGTDSFSTTFAEIDVGCEACHGPGSAHAADPATGRIALAAEPRAWVHRDDDGIASRSPERASGRELETCARCHSRRTQIREGYRPGEAFLDAYMPALLSRGLYHSDGQILDEVYVYGSFVQSPMHAAGVTCSDCHDPHSLEPAASGNGVCAGCHEPARFDTRAHHGHAAGSAGSECVSCHMPGRTYMAIDFRRDHSFRVPRPDLSVETSVPNACNGCHEDRDAAWAAQAVARWFPDGRASVPHYGGAIDAARRWAANRSGALTRLAEDSGSPAIARATAFALMAEQVDASMRGVITSGLDDPEPLVRLGALRALEALPPAQRLAGQARLDDPLRAVRVEAARVLNAARAELSESRRRDLDAALAEYLQMQRLHSDRAFGRVNRAVVARERGELESAERLLREAVEIEPDNAAAYVYLAEMLRGRGARGRALELLNEAVTAAPDDAGAWSALGLARVRRDARGPALEALRRAAELAPQNPEHAHLLGVALGSYAQADEARQVLDAAARRFPGHRDVVYAAATTFRDAGLVERAAELSGALVERFPADREARALHDELERRAR